ncbi:uncharacterized protein BKCO1_5000068 [Diplodia corticola]|uniref:Uncharacterized protein n=1 Tax=Diplodia corticola TaxID=236234 RepID=A0A1J9RFJ3_9PEZI|nr:uncharacterized protein BKCO1_5000068 [Diplodia corticola]OJD31307.1 hypothetical protein BKCO1_5000068 [Diplodia corticola]
MRTLPELLFGINDADFRLILLAVLCGVLVGASTFVLSRLQGLTGLDPHLARLADLTWRDAVVDTLALAEFLCTHADPLDPARLALLDYLWLALFAYVAFEQRLLHLPARPVARPAARTKMVTTTTTGARGRRFCCCRTCAWGFSDGGDDDDEFYETYDGGPARKRVRRGCVRPNAMRGRTRRGKAAVAGAVHAFAPGVKMAENEDPDA